MSRKWRERRKTLAEGSPEAKPPVTPESLRKRRNRRFLFVGLIALSFPLLELIAYQFRAITVTVVNRSNVLVKGIKVVYTGGAYEAAELKSGSTLTRQIRPDFTFQKNQFSTYTLAIRFSTDNGQIFGQMGHVGALDYSAQEIYTITELPPEGRVQLEHTTRPGFPLSLVRDLMGRMGFG